MEGSTNHKETFSALAFKAAGTYTFTVTEQQGTDPTVSYNTTSKSIQVTVEPDADNNLNVTKVTIDGTDITGEAIIGSGVTIENTIIRTKDFEFTKIWKSVDDQQIEEWPTDPTDKTISISLYSTTTGTVGSTDPKIGDFVLSATGGGEDPYTWTGTKNSDNTYTFKITGLPATDGEGNALTYYVKETQVEGYKPPEYGMAQPVTGNNGVESTTVIGKITENNHAKDKEFITNRPDVAVTLPSTGGPGPKLFYGIGLSFIAMAGLLLFIKRNWKGIDPL